MPPERVKFTTYTLRYNECSGIHLNSLERHWEQAYIEAKVFKYGLTVIMQAKNVRSFTVNLPPGSHWVRVRTAQLCRICVGGIGEFDYTNRFFVRTSAPAVSLTVTPMLLARSGSAL